MCCEGRSCQWQNASRRFVNHWSDEMTHVVHYIIVQTVIVSDDNGVILLADDREDR